MDASFPRLLAELPPLEGVGLGWLAVLGVLGLVLLARGARVLPLLALLGGAIGGCALGIRVHQALAMRVPEWAVALAGAMLLASVSVIFLRMGIAWMAAIATGSLSVLLACVLIDRGVLNPSPAPIVRGGAALLDGRSEAMLGAAAPTPRDLAPSLLAAAARSWGDVSPDAGFLTRTAEAWRHARARGDAWWARLPSTAQTLVAAFAWGGFAVGFLCAIVFSRPLSVGLTALLGSLLTLAVAASFLERATGGALALPNSAAPWMMFLAGGTVMGILLQAAPAPKPPADPMPQPDDHG